MKIVYGAIAASVIATSAPAVTLDFSGDICGGPCSNYSGLDQSYGDIAGEVDILWDGSRGTPGLEPVEVWKSGGYESFTDAIFADSSGAGMSIDFLTTSGFDVNLDSISIARYLNSVTNTRIQIIDLLDGSTVFDTGVFATTVNDILTYNVNLSSSAGLSILFGPDAWNVGVGSITYSTSITDDMAPVPLPAGGLLLLAGLGGLAAMKRKRG